MPQAFIRSFMVQGFQISANAREKTNSWQKKIDYFNTQEVGSLFLLIEDIQEKFFQDLLIQSVTALKPVAYLKCYWKPRCIYIDLYTNKSNNKDLCPASSRLSTQCKYLRYLNRMKTLGMEFINPHPPPPCAMVAYELAHTCMAMGMTITTWCVLFSLQSWKAERTCKKSDICIWLLWFNSGWKNL